VPKYKTGAKREAPLVDFQSGSTLLKDSDVYTPVLGHELGHMIGEEHILAMEGDAQCKVNPNLERCYGVGGSPEELANIMGGGGQITQINARPWSDALKSFYPEKGKILDTTTVMLTDPKVQPLPPRKIPDPNPTPVPGRRR
jgi:hypothetical protein